MRQTEEQKKQEELRRVQKEQILRQRQEYVEKTKNALVFSDMPSEKKKSGKKGKSDDQIYSSGEGSGGENDGEENAGGSKKQKKRKSSTDAKERKSRKGKSGGDRSRGKGKRKRDTENESGGT